MGQWASGTCRFESELTFSILPNFPLSTKELIMPPKMKKEKGSPAPTNAEATVPIMRSMTSRGRANRKRRVKLTIGVEAKVEV